jgi:hypothetical protein
MGRNELGRGFPTGAQYAGMRRKRVDLGAKLWQLTTAERERRRWRASTTLRPGLSVKILYGIALRLRAEDWLEVLNIPS